MKHPKLNTLIILTLTVTLILTPTTHHIGLPGATQPASAEPATSDNYAAASKHTTDTDFNAGSFPGMQVSGSGDSASLVDKGDGWESLTSISPGRGRTFGAGYNSEFYVMGGYDGTNTLADAQKHSGGSWVAISNLPAATEWRRSVEYNGEIYVFSTSTYKYDPSTDSWTNLTGMPTDRNRFGIARVGDQVYIIGGLNNENSVQRYNISSDSWTTTGVANLPNNGKRVHSAFAIDGKVYATGGEDSGNTNDNRTYKYDPSTDSWTTVAKIPKVIKRSAGTSHGGYGYVVGGGEDTNGDNFKSVYQYDPAADSWTAITSMGTARDNFPAVGVTDDHLYVAGGVDASGAWSGSAERKPLVSSGSMGEYTSANHSVSREIEKAWANITVDGTSAEVQFQAYTDGSWTTVNSTTISSSQNFTLDVSSASSSTWRTRVNFSDGGTTTEIHDEGVLYKSVEPVDGTVRNQEGEPVANATVEGWGYKGSTYTSSAGELETYSDPIPPVYEDQPALDSGLFGAGGVIESTDTGTAPLIYAESDWPTGFTIKDPDLTQPKLVNVPANQPVVVAVTDLTENDIREDGIDGDIPGKTTDGAVVFQRVDGTGDEMGQPIRVDTTKSYNARDTNSLSSLISGKDHKYAKTSLPDGIYRVHSEGPDGTKSSVEYYIQVGDPYTVITDTLRNEFDRLTERAKAVRDAMNNGKMVRYTTTTDANGDFTINVDKNVKAVQIQAYKRPEGMSGGVNVSSMRTYYETTDYNGSFAFSTSPTRVQPPDSGVELTVYEFQSPPYADPSKYMNQSEFLASLFANQTFKNTVKELLGTNSTELETVREQLTALKNENSRMQQRYEELLTEYRNENGEDPGTKEEIRLLRQTIRELQGELRQIREGRNSEWDGDVVSATIPWNGDVDPSAVVVTAHFPSTGESRPVPDEFVSVNKRPGRGDTVEITDYPVDVDASMVSFSVTVSGEDGEKVGNGKYGVRNPGFSGELLRLNSVSVSTLSPGPSEQVTITPSAREDSASIKSVDATVDGPTGTATVNKKIDGKGVKFTTDGAGRYYVTLNMTDTAGNSWTEGFAIRAGSTDYDSPPSVRVRDGFTGRFAIVGDGLRGGSVATDDGTIRVSAIADSDAIPKTVHIHTDQLSQNYDKTEVRVLKSSSGGTPESARKHVEVYLHTAEISEDAVIYREGNEPIPARGENGNGRVLCDNNESGCTLHSYTEGDGSSTFTINNNPTRFESGIHWARLNVPFNIPFLSVTPVDVTAANPMGLSAGDVVGFLVDLASFADSAVATPTPAGIGVGGAGGGLGGAYA